MLYFWVRHSKCLTILISGSLHGVINEKRNLLSQASPFCNCLIYYEKVIIRLLFVI